MFLELSLAVKAIQIGLFHLKVNLSLGQEDCQHAVIGEFLCMVTGCALGTDVCHWMFHKKSTWFKVNKIPL